tara:strand:- start:784 stop:1812 length:1029 start_codon:yes stop_codon:yes gene_type:complete
MSKEITYRGSRDSVTVVIDGEAHTVRKGTANYRGLMSALADERWDDVPGLVSVRKAVESWAQGEFKVSGGSILFQNDSVPAAISKRIMAMITADEDATPLLNFYERLDRNPSSRSVNQLPGFLDNAGIPMEPDGTFLAYKSVRSDYRDHHSGKVNNKPGQIPKVKRNKVSDDPNHTCHFGLHVGALAYARTFGSGGRIIIVRVDPENVVCVPSDTAEKMRVCTYEVVGDWNGRLMPSTTMETDKAKDRRKGEQPKGKDMPKPKAKAKGGKGSRPKFVADRNVKARWQRWDKWDEVKLLEKPLQELRQYATYHVNLVGASKIPGGKTALVRNIIEVRDGDGHK